MRVLTVVEDLDRGGTQRVAANYAELYRKAGHDSAVLTYQGGGVRVEAVRAAGVDVFVGAREAGSLPRATAAAGDWSPDAVHLHRPGWAHPVTAGIIRELKGRSAARGRRLGVLETNVFARVDYSPDRELIDIHGHLSRWCLWKWRRWSAHCRPRPVGALLPNVVIPDGFAPLGAGERGAARERLGLPAGAFVLGRVGSPLAGKWSWAALEAYRRVAMAHDDVWMLLVGMPEELRREAARLKPGVRQRLVDVPYLSGDGALRDAYGAMDVQVHSSRIGESFGMVLAEAMLCRTPCVTLATPAKDNSQGEVVGHGRGGLVAASVPGLVEAIERLRADRALRERLGAEGRERVLREYAPAVLVPRALRLIRVACEAPDRAALAEALRREGVAPDISGAEIRAVMRESVGAYPVRTRALVPLVANPRVYRAYAKALRLG
jgi:glycosyltransferase involved in cell wall biosynthesis